MPTNTAPTAPEFQSALSTIFRKATREGGVFVEVKSGDLHRMVGDIRATATGCRPVVTFCAPP